MSAAKILIETAAPCRERSGYCDTNGECMQCFASSGEACRRPPIVAQIPCGRRGGNCQCQQAAECFYQPVIVAYRQEGS